MDNETLFYVCGGILAASAVIVTFAGLKLKDFPGRALPIVVLWFAVFAGGASTFAVLHAKDEAAHGAETEHAGEEHVEGEGEASATTLQLAADPSGAPLFDQKELTAKAGKVTIDFTNDSPAPHNVVIEKDGEELAGFEPITEGEKSVSAELEPGAYTFLCTVPGHAQAGMQGTLTVE